MRLGNSEHAYRRLHVHRLSSANCTCPSAIEIGTNQKGGRTLKLDGYIYFADRVTSTKTIRRCQLMKQCKARVHTSCGQVVHGFNKHTHAPLAATVKALHIVNQIH